MGELVPLDDPSNYAVVAKKIKRLWNTGEYELLPHIEARMVERNLDLLDVENVIKYGRVIDHSCPNGIWRYVLFGKCAEGLGLKCVVEVSDHQLTLVSIMVRGRVR